MGDHFALLVNRLLTESTLHDAIENRNCSKEASEVDLKHPKKYLPNDLSVGNLVECRICQDEDLDSNMETPCSCRGSLKYAHHRCVQRWCDEKGDTTCEICCQQFRPGYTSSRQLVQYRRIQLNVRRNWEISRRALSDSPFIRMVPADQEADSDSDESSSRSLRCLAVAIIFMVLLILRHTLPIIIYGPDCCFPLIILVVLRMAGCALLLYIILLAVIGLQHYQHTSGYSGGSTPSTQDISHVIQVE